jgi:DNA-binding NarL/FixJ family response regulator
MHSKLFVLDAHPVVLTGIHRILEHHPDIQVSGVADSMSMALPIMKQEPPGVLLVDPAQGDHDALDFLASIQQQVPSVPILVFTLEDEQHLAKRCMQAGIMGYIRKTEPVASLLMAVRQVAAGGIAYSADLIQKMIAGNSVRNGGLRRSGPGQMLSMRQLEVFEMIGQGMDSQSIADKLGLSPRTVDVHKANIRNSLGLASASEVLRSAILWVKDKGSNETSSAQGGGNSLQICKLKEINGNTEAAKAVPPRNPKS